MTMSWPGTNNLAGLKKSVCSVAFLLVVTMMSAPPQSSAQAMQQGISVKMAPTSSAVAVPDTDRQDALIVTVTDTGKLYFGIIPVTPDSLAAQLKGRLAQGLVSRGLENVYIKADARAPYAYVVKVLDAARTAGVERVTLLTTQPKTMQTGAVVFPQGIEMEMARRSAATSK
jgi:biopolymer transport protein ExbD